MILEKFKMELISYKPLKKLRASLLPLPDALAANVSL